MFIPRFIALALCVSVCMAAIKTVEEPEAPKGEPESTGLGITEAVPCEKIPCPEPAMCIDTPEGCKIQCVDGWHFRESEYRCVPPEDPCKDVECPENMKCFANPKRPHECTGECADGFKLDTAKGCVVDDSPKEEEKASEEGKKEDL